MITVHKPTDFNSIYTVVGCFIERKDGKILLLRRLPGKSEGNKWGVPAGKAEGNENLKSAIMREVQEETGIVLSRSLKLFGTYYVRYPEYDFVYHLFHSQVFGNIQVRISNFEHRDFLWVKPREALRLDLVTHQDDCTRFFYFADDGNGPKLQ